MRNAYDILEERGLVKQCSHPEELHELMGKEKLTFYIGFDPTADSLHIGHYVALMTMAHMQRAGHRPIVLLGGGTAFIGDPSGKTDMRRMMTTDEIDHNAACFQKQMSRVLSFEGENAAIVENNANWLRSLNFLEFMRDIGSLFSVNRMLSADCYKLRMERGLTFFEMGYMLMQSYDFLMLHQKYGCVLEMGGDDQWSNILSGADLIRRKEQHAAFALTTGLLATSEGKKMGKTEKGALWLDPEKTSVFDFYQYWRNVDDSGVENCLKMLTFMPIDEIKAITAPTANINEAKKILAYTLTAQVHGEEAAKKAQQAAEALFGGGGDIEHMPTIRLSQAEIESTGLRVTDLLVLGKLCTSKSDARRTIEGGGVLMDDVKVTDVYAAADPAALENGIILKKGKKGVLRVLKG